MEPLHIVCIPVMAYGHMIPMLDMAKLLSSRGLKTTFITTPAFADPIKRAQESGYDIALSIVKFPPKRSSLPDHVVRLDQMPTPDLVPKFFEALDLLQEPIETILQELQPINCIVSDPFFTWTTDSATKFGVPRLVFHVTCCFALCCQERMKLDKPYKSVLSDSETFSLPNLPHKMMFTKTQVSDFDMIDEEDVNDGVMDLREKMKVAEERSYGIVLNSFIELESAYADHFKNVLGGKAWHLGPYFLRNNIDKVQYKAQRGKELAIDEHECLAWLDSKKPNSVVYACFGSVAAFTCAQLHETAAGLEASVQDFIWVVSKGKNGDEGNEDWMPEGFEERTKGKGLIIRGWAPQVMILDHPAIGAFITHCGWNSTLEGICVGAPMVTWPRFAEQFYNEKLVVDVLGIGVSVGNKIWGCGPSEGVPREAVAKAVRRIMVGEAATEMRSRAKNYKEMARKAVEEGGSSYNTLNDLIEQVSNYVVPPEKQAMKPRIYY